MRYTLICPAVLGIIYIGAFEASRNWGDLWALLFFGLVGWIMKQFKWPRPPLILGLVLGDIIERYMFISIGRYGLDWMLRPLVVLLFALAIIGLARPVIQDYKNLGGVRGIMTSFGKARFEWGILFTTFYMAVIGTMTLMALPWRYNAKIVPLVVGFTALTAVSLSLFNQIFRKPAEVLAAERAAAGGKEPDGANLRIHMDLESDTAHVPLPVLLRRAVLFFSYLLGFMGSTYVIGLIPTLFCFIIFFMRNERKEPWVLVLSYAVCMVIFVTIVFDRIMSIPWPQTLLGQWVPALKGLIPSV